jgi:hypothetical protein
MIRTSAVHTDDQVSIDVHGGIARAKLITQTDSSISMRRAVEAIKRVTKQRHFGGGSLWMEV